MVSKITSNVKVTVIPEYDRKNSYPSGNRFVFKYYITIENLGAEPIQLLKRKWLIYDLGYGFTEVMGEGVIGLTPEIRSGEYFTYFSNVLLMSGVGNMSGTYLIKNLNTTKELEIDIPKFSLMTDILNN